MEEGRWAFRGSELSWCPPGRYGHTSVFDPFPAYPHDRAVAEAAAEAAAEACPPLWDVDLYLAGHEYGHNVGYMLNSLRGARHIAGTDDLQREYAAMRGLPGASVHHGEGGNWHDSACEIMACDFRILVCVLETGFWPHPGIPWPGDIPAVRDWWDQALARLAEARAIA